MANSDPVAAVSEADASGEIVALYADIRATLGVPLVNLIWRHLATIPGGLGWAWTTVKPLYASNAIAREAYALRIGLDVPSVMSIDERELASAGLDSADLAQISIILRSYERSNAMNMVALGALLARLNDEQDTTTHASAAPSEFDDHSVGGRVPPLLNLDAMSSELLGLVTDVNAIGGREDIMASMYRHLAHWPAFLTIVRRVLMAASENDRLEATIVGVIDDARRRSRGLIGDLATSSESLTPQHAEAMRAALHRFVQGPIGKMTAIVAVLSDALPSSLLRDAGGVKGQR